MSEEPQFERCLSRVDLLLFSVSAILTTAFIAGACLLFFKPAPGAQSFESWLLGAETLVTLVVGLAVMPRRRRHLSSR